MEIEVATLITFVAGILLNLVIVLVVLIKRKNFAKLERIVILFNSIIDILFTVSKSIECVFRKQVNGHTLGSSEDFQMCQLFGSINSILRCCSVITICAISFMKYRSIVKELTLTKKQLFIILIVPNSVLLIVEVVGLVLGKFVFMPTKYCMLYDPRAADMYRFSAFTFTFLLLLFSLVTITVCYIRITIRHGEMVTFMLLNSKASSNINKHALKRQTLILKIKVMIILMLYYVVLFPSICVPISEIVSFKLRTETVDAIVVNTFNFLPIVNATTVLFLHENVKDSLCSLFNKK